MKMVCTLAACMLLTAGALTAQQTKNQKDTAAAPKTVTAQIFNIAGENIGTAVFSPASPGVKLQIDMRKMSPGDHGFHIHQLPSCDASEDFNTSGLQFDPGGQLYGHHDHKGPSDGNPQVQLKIGPDGTGHLTTILPNLTLGTDDHSILRDTGTAIVFHASAKDNADGNGPTRIACGVISKPVGKSAKQ